MGDVQKTAGFARRVDRQVEDVVGLIVIFTDFVARRGEKREQDFVFGMFLADFFDQGTALFEFAQGGGMYPDNASRGSMLSFMRRKSPFRPSIQSFAFRCQGEANAMAQT